MNFIQSSAAVMTAQRHLMVWAAKTPGAAGLNKVELRNRLGGDAQRVAADLGGDARLQRIIRRAVRRVEAAERAARAAFLAGFQASC